MTLASEVEANMNKIQWLLSREGSFCADDRCVATARGDREWDVPRLAKCPSVQFGEKLRIQYNM